MNRLTIVLLGLSALVAVGFAASCTCGREQLNTRIIKGREAQRGRYPWLVSLMTNMGGGSYSSCGASIINDRYILTAAHCLASNPRPSDIIAMVGAHTDNERFRAQSPKQKQLEIKRCILHPNYVHEGRKMDDDIALCELKHPLTFDNEFMPICLPNFADIDNLCIYGWGRQDDKLRGVLKSSEVLHEVDVDEVENSTCIAKYWGNTFLPEKEICAGTKAGSCQGDSGGPLSTRRDGQMYQVGVVSFGAPGCGVEGQMKPDIYERVTAHLEWIEENTGDAKWCPADESPEFTKKSVAEAGADGSFRKANEKEAKESGPRGGSRGSGEGLFGPRPSKPSRPSGGRRGGEPSIDDILKDFENSGFGKGFGSGFGKGFPKMPDFPSMPDFDMDGPGVEKEEKTLPDGTKVTIIKRTISS